eukprot:CAMPEP_0180147098 /NCGR_PEP_ID=MMETSP0986-20121125/19015_1 /TAXON_ID=697907 /ORGANISM="non described non described, Strain CCMP2293" /LENGTH=429 /DNA_ID=CAMNT_0022092505 /DNA_START=49 /DNA_END=1338 /DNA_ORIENTATION=+
MADETDVDAALIIRPVVQNYAWGVPGGGSTSLVARMANAPPSDGTPFAELWMGTHPKAPAVVLGAGAGGGDVEIGEFLAAHPSFHGKKVLDVFGLQLPYLFKILSVAKALSIQAHPHKELAERLHARDPNNYPDANHKPELACAVSRFEGLCGFRPLPEIVKHLHEVPELHGLVGPEAASSLAAAAPGGDAEAQRGALKSAFAALMSSPTAEVDAAATALVARLEALQPAGALSGADELVLRINVQFPKDIGLFNIYFLNHCVLEPGEALFLGPNLPHAYLSGDCMEIMATSDNVVRAGFTPKFKDVETLVEMLTYAHGPASVLSGDEESPGVRLYAPPSSDFPEFSLRRVEVTSVPASLAASVAPRIAIVVSGEASISATPREDASSVKPVTLAAKEGTVVLIAASAQLQLSGSGLVFIAACHPSFEA